MPRSAFYSHRLTSHASTATASHEAAASTRAPTGDCTIISQIRRPKARQPETSKRRSGGIERRGFLAATRSRKTRFLLAFPDMLFEVAC